MKDRRIFSADWTLRIASQFEFTEFHFQRIEMQETPAQGLARSDDQLQCFRGLDQSVTIRTHDRVIIRLILGLDRDTTTLTDLKCLS